MAEGQKKFSLPDPEYVNPRAKAVKAITSSIDAHSKRIKRRGRIVELLRELEEEDTPRPR